MEKVKSTRYELKTNFSQEEVELFNKVREDAKSKLSQAKFKLSDKQQISLNLINQLFDILAEQKEYMRELAPSLDGKFEHEDSIYDCELMDNVEAYSAKNVDRVLRGKMHSITEDKAKLILGRFQNPTFISQMGDMSVSVAKLLQSSSQVLTPEMLVFIKKTQFVSDALSKPEIAKVFGIEAVGEKDLDALKQQEKIDAEKLAGLEKDEVVLARDGDKDLTVADIAKQFIDGKVEQSKMGKDGAKTIEGCKQPEVALLCGKSELNSKSVYSAQLQQRGYLNIDLDEIAKNIAFQKGIALNNQTSGTIYKMARFVRTSIIEQSMQRGYNISIEGVGSTKESIEAMADKVDEIEGKVYPGKEKGKGIYSKSLKMTASGAVKSANENALNTAEQIADGKMPCNEQFTTLLARKNGPEMAYLDLITDKDVLSRFKQVSITSTGLEKYDELNMINGVPSEKYMQLKWDHCIQAEASEKVMQRKKK